MAYNLGGDLWTIHFAGSIYFISPELNPPLALVVDPTLNKLVGEVLHKFKYTLLKSGDVSPTTKSLPFSVVSSLTVTKLGFCVS